MSGFKIVGDKYVSEWNGNSLNPGTQASPYKHPADSGTTDIHVLGAGVYKGLWSGIKTIKADGEVLLDFLGTATNNTNPTYIYGCRLKDMLGILGSTGNFGNFDDCVFDNCPRISFRLGGTNQNARNVLLPCVDGAYTAPNSSFNLNNSQIYEDIIQTNSVGTAATFWYNFIPKGVKITWLQPVTNIRNCLINGIINVSGVDYELKKLFDGSTRPDADPLIPDLITAYSAVYTNGNYAGEAKILDAVTRICEPDSDLLKRSNANGFVGGVKPGKRILVNASDPNISISSTGIDTTTDPGNWRIQDPNTEGFIEIIWRISNTITEVQKILLDSLLSFDGSQAGGSLGNNNVPDLWPTAYSPLSNPDMKPNRLNYALRTSQSVSMPTIDSQWDNDASTLGTTPGDFYIQEWNTKPTISDVLGAKYGNGNEAGFGGTTNSINARWAHAKIRLTNNRAY